MRSWTYRRMRTKDLCQSRRLMHSTHVVYFVCVIGIIDMDFIRVNSDDRACVTGSANSRHSTWAVKPTIFLMEFLQLKSVLANEIDIVVVFIQIRRFCELWTWDMCQGMKKESINDKYGDIADISDHRQCHTRDKCVKHRETVNPTTPG